jgi:putative DNA primase/helicase
MANLAGMRSVLANEVEAGASMSGQTVKVAVSTEAITARHLYGAPFTFKPTHKLFIRGNHRPRINDNDEGIWRRIHLIPFDLNLPVEQRDQWLEGRLLNEAPGILAWMVRGYQKWRREGLRPARRVLDASLAYRRESDLLAQWVEDHCEKGQDKSGMFSAVQLTAYANYRCWCHEQGLRQFSKKSFTRGLIEQGFKEGRQGSGQRLTTYIGFRLLVS